MIYIKAIISTREKGFPGYTAGALFDCISHFMKLLQLCNNFLHEMCGKSGLKCYLLNNTKPISRVTKWQPYL